jgi:peptidoglycan/LPS O-acetylase OafA/YrhL
MPEPVKSDQKYLPGLDGLRALAVAAVVAYHLGYGWAQGGLLGVGVFFTLSGYLITDILVGQWARAGRIGLGDFWLRRARRLLPALFVMLAVVAVWVNVLARSFVPGFRGDVVASALYVSNWWYVGQHTSYYARFAPPAPLDHLWSLAVEEQFYLAWPWVVLLLLWLAGRLKRQKREVADLGPDGSPYLSRRGRWGLAGVTAGLAVASAIAMAMLYHPGYDPTRVYEGTDTRAFGLLIGAAVALVWPTRRGGPTPTVGARRALDAAGLGGLAVIAVLVWRTNQYSPFMFRGGLVLLSVATGLVVAAVVTPGGLLGRALGGRPLRWLGVRSYAIYLWHYPVIVLTAPADGAGAPVSLARAAAVVAATVAIAAVSWRIVEDPIRRGRHRSRAATAAEGIRTSAGSGWRTRSSGISGPLGSPGSLGPSRSPGPLGSLRASRSPGPLGSLRALGSPVVIGGLCLLGVAVFTAGIAALAPRLDSGTAGGTAAGAAARPGGAVTAAGQPAAVGSLTGRDRSSRDTSSKDGNGTGTRGTRRGRPGGPGNGASAGAHPARLVAAAGPAATVAALPTPAPRTSCTSVVHIGDSTSEGLISADYLPDPADRITARYADVGVRNSIMRIVGATSVVEALPGTQNAYTMASQLVHGGYHGCWVLALGTNDTADVYVGSNVDRAARIKEMMTLIGNQPVMWVEVKSLLSSGPYSEQNMELWDQALRAALPHYKNMRLYDWPAVVQSSWFISDEIHYTSNGYAHRATMIANALAAAFPAA